MQTIACNAMQKTACNANNCMQLLQAEAAAACDEDAECSFFVFDAAANAAVRFCSGLKNFKNFNLQIFNKSAGKGWAHAAPSSGLAVAVKPGEFL